MAIRYLARRSNPQDFAEILALIPNLDEQLGSPAADFKRTITVNFNPVRSAQYYFSTRKVAEGWQWTCASLEVSGENEAGLFALCDRFRIPRPDYLVVATTPT